MKPTLLYIEETIDSTTGPTHLRLEPYEHKKKPDVHSYMRCRFEIIPYHPLITGELVRQGVSLGKIPLDKNHLNQGHTQDLDQGLIQAVRCLNEKNEELTRWTFQTVSNTTIKLQETCDPQTRTWYSTLMPWELKGENRVYIIPIGARWKDRSRLETLTQTYAFLRTKENTREVVWNITDSQEMVERGIPLPMGGVRGTQWFKSIYDEPPLFPSSKDIKAMVTVEDITRPLQGFLTEAINPFSLQTTLLFKDT